MPRKNRTLIDLSQIDFDALKAHFEKGRKHTEAEKLKAAVSKKLQQMVQLNKTRTDLLEKFKKLIEEYNKGIDVDGFFEKLVAFVKELNEEDQRGVAEQLSEEELAIFDILTKPTPDLPPKEKKEVKKIARSVCCKRSSRPSWCSIGARSCAPVPTCSHGEDGSGRPAPHLHAGTVSGEVRPRLSAHLRRLPGRGEERVREPRGRPRPASRVNAAYFFFGSSGGSSMSLAVIAIGAPFSGMSMWAVQRMPFTTSWRKSLMPKLS